MYRVAKKQIGKAAMMLTFLADSPEFDSFQNSLHEMGYSTVQGRVGTMDAPKIVAAVETAAKKNGLIQSTVYRESHAIYHAIMEALLGVGRGAASFGSQLRTVGLKFAVVRGKPFPSPREQEWLAVAFYGTIGAPVKGFEHEALGLGINHI